MIGLAARAFGLLDRIVLTRLPPETRSAAFRVARRAKARISGGIPDPDAGAPTSLGVKRRGAASRLPPGIIDEIGALRAEVDASLFEDGLPGPSRYQSVYPVNPAPGRALRRLLADLSAVPGPTHVYIVPWVRRGGADVVLLAHLNAVVAAGGKPWVLTTMPDDSPWSSRMPPGTGFAEVGKACDGLSERDALLVVARIVAESSARTVHVINSALGWRLMGRHGAAMSNGRRVFASLFWDDAVRPDGRASGFAHQYLLAADAFIAGYASDNRTYLDVLHRRYGVAAERLHVVRTPVDIPPHAGAARGRRVLWASRMAPEKLPGVLAAVAAKCPDLAFDVHGEVDPACHDAHRSLLNLPNVTFHGSYDGFGSLDVVDAGAFLYTSDRDGMPNVLLEAGSAGIPVVSSIVGAIGELVDAGTGWPVMPGEGVDGYVAALRAALGPEGPRRAEAMSERIHARHDGMAVGRALRDIPGYL